MLNSHKINQDKNLRLFMIVLHLVIHKLNILILSHIFVHSRNYILQINILINCNHTQKIHNFQI